MFTKTLDSKKIYTDDDGLLVVNITDGIFNSQYDMGTVHSLFKATKECEMRPDYIASCVYGDEAYTEMIVKSSMIENPFAIEEGDIIYSMRIDSVYHSVKEDIVNPNAGNSVYELVKKYHKYIDKSKVPDKPGSDKNEIVASSSPSQDEIPLLEANISKTGKTGVTITNGKIYFGANEVADTKTPDFIAGEALQKAATPENMATISTERDKGGSKEEKEIGYTAGGNISLDDGKLKFDIDEELSENFINSGKETSGITVDNGIVHFENADGSDIEPGLIVPVNSSEVDCAKTGISLGKFLNAGINNCRMTS